MLKKLAFVTMAIYELTGLANAADLGPLPPAESDWIFTLAPYGWAIGVNSSVQVRNSPTVDFNVGFSDILKALDAPPVMMVGQARNGRFSIGGDLIWSKLSNDAQTPRGFVSFDGSLEMTSLTGVGGYSLLYDDSYNLDVVAGARMWSFDIGLDVKGPRRGISFGRSTTWLDPVVGLKGHADISPDFYLDGWALIGGFNVSGDKLMWDVEGSIGYDFTDNFSMTAGYRGMGLDYSKKNASIDATFSGPLIGAVFKF